MIKIDDIVYVQIRGQKRKCKVVKDFANEGKYFQVKLIDKLAGMTSLICLAEEIEVK